MIISIGSELNGFSSAKSRSRRCSKVQVCATRGVGFAVTDAGDRNGYSRTRRFQTLSEVFGYQGHDRALIEERANALRATMACLNIDPGERENDACDGRSVA